MAKNLYEDVKEILFLIDYMMENTSENHKISEAELAMAYRRHREQTKKVAPKPGNLSAKVYNWQVAKDDKATKFLEAFRPSLNRQMFHNIKLGVSNDKFKGKTPNRDKQYYIDGPLSEMTVNILRDAIAVYPYVGQDMTQQIIDELNAVTNKFNRREYNLPKVDANKYPGNYYRDNLMEIYAALSTSKPDEPAQTLSRTEADKDFAVNERLKMTSKRISCLQFKYYHYDADPVKKKLELVQNKPVKRTLKDGTVKMIENKVVNPLMLLWSNGYYYLVTYYKNRNTGEYVYINYRVDRMKDVKCRYDKDAEAYDDLRYMIDGKFEPQRYMNKNPVMYSSAKRVPQVEIKCSRTILNNVVDTFGVDVEIKQITNDEVIFTAKNITSEGVIMWALEYGENCEILNPPELRSEMKRRAENMLNKY